MNAEQKKRAAELLSAWRATAYALHADRMAELLQELVDAPEVLTATNPAQISSLAEPFGYFKSEPFGWTDCAETDDGAIALYTAPPEPKPVARVTGYYAGHTTIITLDGRVLPAGTALYAAPPHQSEHHLEMVNTPAPSVPDGLQTIPSHDQLTKILNGLDRCVSAESRREFLRVWIRDWTAYKLAAAPTPAEPPADVVRDAARLRQFEKWANTGYAPCLAYDDDGHWQISFDGFNAVGEPLGRVTIFTEKDDWHDSVGEAIDAAIERQGASDEPRL